MRDDDYTDQRANPAPFKSCVLRSKSPVKYL
jgi:hypothetical protein